MFVRPLAAVALAVGVLSGCTEHPPAPSGPRGGAASSTSAVPAGPTQPRALRVLHAWDARRAAAYSRGDVPALRRLYVDGSDACARDVALLRSYTARGLAVEHLAMQVVAADVLVDRGRVVRLRVTERVADGRVTRVGDEAGASVALPHDRLDRHEVALVRTADGWVVRSATRG